MRKSKGVLAAALAVVGCGVEYDPAFDVDEEVAEEASPIINGTNDFTNYLNESLRTIKITRDVGGFCSGTVLRPTIVLTAVHCVNSNGFLSGNPLPPGQLRINGQGAIDLWVEVDSMVDAAVLQFAQPVINDIFTAIDPYPPTKYLGDGLMVTGYGFDENGMFGVLRRGFQTVRAVDVQYDIAHSLGRGMRASNSLTGTATAQGDSGGPLWGTDLYPRPVAGIDSSSAQTAFGSTNYAQAKDFRYEIRYWAYERYDPSLSVSFNSPSEVTSNFTPLQAVSGTAANWQVTGGALVQMANAPQTFMMQKGAFENVFLSTILQSSDDDSMGLVFRFVDKDNHYRCEANQAIQAVRIIRRRNGTDSIRSSATWTGSFNTVMQVRAIEKSLECTVGNVTTSVSGASNFPIGQVGMYNNFNNGGKFMNWAATSLEPVDGTW